MDTTQPTAQETANEDGNARHNVEDEELVCSDSYLCEDPCEQLGIVEEEVARVSAKLSRLVLKMHILKERVNEKNSHFIRLLPPEIVAEIFLFCIPIFHQVDDSHSTTKNASMPLRLGAVCASWRRVAWSVPKLWCSVSFHLTSALRFPLQVVLLDQWLGRTGQLPLSIRMGSNEEIVWVGLSCEDMMKVIGKHAARWRDIDICLPSTIYRYLPSCEEANSFPHLRSIVLRPPGGQGDRIHKINLPVTPQLRELSLSCLYLRSVVFHLEFLTHLELESFYIDETLEMLRQTTSLVTFNAKKILGGDDRHPIPEESLVLPLLENLCLINDKGADLPLFFQKISTPKLRSLSYTSDVLQNLPWVDVIALIKRSACELECLTLEKAPITEEHLQLLLASMPTLASLVLNMPFISGLTHAPLTDNLLQTWDPNYARSNKLSCAMPKLRNIMYQGAKGFTWPTLLRVLESRCPLPASKDVFVQASSSGSGKPAPSTATVVSCIENISIKLQFNTSEECLASPPPDATIVESLANRGVKIIGNVVSQGETSPAE